jgi:hypothetical protein
MNFQPTAAALLPLLSSFGRVYQSTVSNRAAEGDQFIRISSIREIFHFLHATQGHWTEGVWTQSLMVHSDHCTLNQVIILIPSKMNFV